MLTCKWCNWAATFCTNSVTTAKTFSLTKKFSLSWLVVNEKWALFFMQKAHNNDNVTKHRSCCAKIEMYARVQKVTRCKHDDEHKSRLAWKDKRAIISVFKKLHLFSLADIIVRLRCFYICKRNLEHFSGKQKRHNTHKDKKRVKMSTIRKRIPTDYLVIESFSCYGISLWPQFNLKVLFVVKMKTINHHGNFFKDTHTSSLYQFQN